MGCIFCEIVAHKAPGTFLAQNEHSLALAPSPETIAVRGHMLVIPKKHYESVHDMPLAELNSVMALTKRIANLLRKRSEMKGINILHASGKYANQSVLHFHLHIFPRVDGDNIDAWPHTSYKETAFEGVYTEIKRLLQK